MKKIIITMLFLFLNLLGFSQDVLTELQQGILSSDSINIYWIDGCKDKIEILSSPLFVLAVLVLILMIISNLLFRKKNYSVAMFMSMLSFYFMTTAVLAFTLINLLLNIVAINYIDTLISIFSTVSIILFFVYSHKIMYLITNCEVEKKYSEDKNIFHYTSKYWAMNKVLYSLITIFFVFLFV